MSKFAKIGLFSGWLLTIAAIAFFVMSSKPDETDTFSAQIMNDKIVGMDAQTLSDEFHVVLPEMLATIYEAFGKTQEAAIYDQLATVSAGKALETLYLERAGAMVGGGLEKADQTLHEMELKGMSSQRSGTTFSVNVKWRVVGTVGHATHLHVRGNTYTADLTIKPVDTAWRMTAFNLTDVDRTDAGERVAGE